jgi:FAD binding domain in molybdopterin dehydrogenase
MRARANDVVDAVRQIAGDPNAKFVAGGANLIDLMKMDVERPTKVIDITRLPLNSETFSGTRFSEFPTGMSSAENEGGWRSAGPCPCIIVLPQQ